jgi:hypothetical protein
LISVSPPIQPTGSRSSIRPRKFPVTKVKANSLDYNTQREIVKILVTPSLKEIRFATLCKRNTFVFGACGSALRRQVQNRYNYLRKFQASNPTEFRRLCFEFGVENFGQTVNNNCTGKDNWSPVKELSGEDNDDDSDNERYHQISNEQKMSKPSRYSLTTPSKCVRTI